MMRARRRVNCASAALAALLVEGAAPAQAALCGDTSGDGWFTAADALFTLKLAVAGGEDRRGDVQPAGGNGSLTASDALESLRAAVQGRIPSCRGPKPTRAAVVTHDVQFSSGGFAVVDIATRDVTFRGGSISRDAVARAPGGLPMVVNRQGTSSLQVLDVDTPSLAYVKECSVSTPEDSNPQDVLFVSETKGYVTAYNVDELLVIDPRIALDPKLDPACAGILTKRIDLGAEDEDGIPEMDQMALVDGLLFVSLQLLDEAKQPKGPSRVLVVDPATDAVVDRIELSFANPFASTKGIPFDEFQGLLFLGGPGSTGTNLEDGGIEAIDPVTRTSAGMLVTGADLGGNLFDFVVVGTGRAFAVIADLDANAVVEVDLEERRVIRELLRSEALITDIEMTEAGELWVAYRGLTKADPPGIRIFRVTDGAELTVRVQGDEVVPAPVAIGQAPFSLVFFE